MDEPINTAAASLELALIDAGLGRAALGRPEVLRLNTGADSGTWSPDGKRIAFRCRSGTGQALSFRLCTSKLNGTSFRRFLWPVGSAEPDWGTHA